MCGIAGCFSKDLNERDAFIVDKVLSAQFARGPDNLGKEKFLSSQYQGILGHNRLKIIDLSAHANQPMWNAERNLCISFNGEIYNYLELKKTLQDLQVTFNTASDTEVILAAYQVWGIECLARFNGAFAFALYDKNKHILILARDRFGKKPLFYCQEGGKIYFSSSARPLAKNLALNPNFEYLARGLKYWVYEDGSNISPYERLQALPSGHYLSLDLNSFVSSTHQFYSLKDSLKEKIEFCASSSPAHLTELISQTLNDAVSIRLRADVPVGLSLSGGLDSSILAAIAADKHKQMHSFTFGDPSLAHTEAPLVDQFSKNLSLQAHFTYPSVDDFTENFFNAIAIQDGPFPSFSIGAQYLVYRRAKEQNIRVLLGGQGADEGFMGYRKFHLFHLKNLLKKKNIFELAGFLFQFSSLLYAEKSQLKKFWQNRLRYANREQDSALTIKHSMPINLNNHSDLTNRQVEDICEFSLPSLLRYEDRNSMANSIESRLPFMDFRLIELGVALPLTLKLNKGYGKWVLREISKTAVPDFIRLAKFKRGFDVSTKTFIHTGVGKAIRRKLNEGHTHIKDYIITNKPIDFIFSDLNLSDNPARLSEAITLLWLINHQEDRA